MRLPTRMPARKPVESRAKRIGIVSSIVISTERLGLAYRHQSLYRISDVFAPCLVKNVRVPKCAEYRSGGQEMSIQRNVIIKQAAGLDACQPDSLFEQLQCSTNKFTTGYPPISRCSCS